jgi:FlaG protein
MTVSAMSLEIGRFTPNLHAAALVPPTPARAHAGAPEARPAAMPASDIPATPPDEVRAQVEAAAKRAEELAANNRELHFAKDAETGRIVIQVRQLDGRVVRTIPPSHALALMTGAL